MMLDAGILNYLLLSMTASSDPRNDEIIDITNILWSLIKSISSPEKLPDSLKNLPAPTPSAMRYSILKIFAVNLLIN